MRKPIKYLIFAFILLWASSITIHAQTGDDSATTAPATWEGERRLTVLILGMDRRPDERDSLTVRTDVVILASIDPAAGAVGLLHIPRDLHFAPPGMDDLIRVNTLMQEGESQQDGYGPYYVMDTLQYNLGMYIDRYILVDFQAFITLVDAIGGVEITTDYTINDTAYPDMEYGYDTFYLPAGTHTLDGEEALKYARTRHADNDFLRGQRQIEVLQAVHEKVTADSTTTALLRQAPQLLADLRGNLYTDLTLDEIVMLALLVEEMPAEAIETGIIDTEYNFVYTVDSGRNVYVPDREKMIDLLMRVFGENYNQ